jgi:hypothetical protein
MKSLRQQIPTVTLAAGAAGTRAMAGPVRARVRDLADRL